jgi:hypothetical protein
MLWTVRPEIQRLLNRACAALVGSDAEDELRALIAWLMREGFLEPRNGALEMRPWAELVLRECADVRRIGRDELRVSLVLAGVIPSDKGEAGGSG